MSDLKSVLNSLPDVLPYSDCFKVGIIDQKLGDDGEKFTIPTPLGDLKRTLNYTLRKTYSISKYARKINELKGVPIVLVSYYGIVQIPIKKVEINGEKIIFVHENPPSTKTYIFEGNSLKREIFVYSEFADDSDDESHDEDIRTVRDFYRVGNADLVFEKHTKVDTDLGIDTKKNNYMARFPETHVEGNDDPYTDRKLHTKSTVVHRKRVAEGKITQKETNLSYHMPTHIIYREILELEGKEKKDRTQIRPFDSTNTFNYENCFDLLSKYDPSLPIPRKLMKQMLTQLDTDISRSDRHKMGGPLMDVNLMKTIGSYVGKQDFYETSSEEEKN